MDRNIITTSVEPPPAPESLDALFSECSILLELLSCDQGIRKQIIGKKKRLNPAPIIEFRRRHCHLGKGFFLKISPAPPSKSNMFFSNFVGAIGAFKDLVGMENHSKPMLVQKQVRNCLTDSSMADAAAAAGSAAAGRNMVKGQWTADEDCLLIRLVKQHGVRKWSQIAKNLVGRIGKQCRERWHNQLRPDIKMFEELKERETQEPPFVGGWKEASS